jgi:iron complex outermembrane receptor protein
VKRNFGYRGFGAGGEIVWDPIAKLQLVAGGEIVYDDEEIPTASRIDKLTGEVFDDGVQAASSRSHRVLVNPGAYLQANWLALDPYIRITAGLRYDWHNIYGSQIAGRGGLVSHWGKKRRVTTKLLYGSAFKAPSPVLLYAMPLRPGDVVGNADLDPQIVHTLEAQLAWAPRHEFGLSTGVAASMVRDKAEFRPHGINITAQNIASQESLSWETRADFRPLPWLRGYASFDLQEGYRALEQTNYVAHLIGTRNIVHPLWITRAGLDVSITQARLGLMLQAMGVGKRRAADANIVENGAPYSLPPYALLNAAIRTDEFKIFGRGLTQFSLHGYNVTNTRTPDPGFAGYDYPRMPLEVLLKVTHFHR